MSLQNEIQKLLQKYKGTRKTQSIPIDYKMLQSWYDQVSAPAGGGFSVPNELSITKEFTFAELGILNSNPTNYWAVVEVIPAVPGKLIVLTNFWAFANAPGSTEVYEVGGVLGYANAQGDIVTELPSDGYPYIPLSIGDGANGTFITAPNFLSNNANYYFDDTAGVGDALWLCSGSSWAQFYADPFNARIAPEIILKLKIGYILI